MADGLIGTTLDGKYRLDAQLGVGGMGAVYRGTRVLIGDEVAIKVLLPDTDVNPEAAERFRREARTAARLKHPNAVAIYDFGVTPDGLMYLVMEFVEGRSLRQMIRQQGALDLQPVTEITTQVCAALEEAHHQDIIHRDIKPDNIIVREMQSGLRVTVLDFGIAKLRDLTVSNLTQTGSVMGTPQYMSPEQCMGEGLDTRSDIYSVGIVLYEMLCGMVPFNSPTSTAVAVQQVTQAPPPPRSLNPGISPAVEAVVLHALEKKREARPQSAAALAQELKAAAYSQPSTQPAAENRTNRTPEATQVMSRLGSGHALPANAGQYSSGSSPTASAGRRRWPIVVAALIAVSVLGVAFGATAWFLRSRTANGNSANGNGSKTSASKPANNVATGSPSPSGPREDSKNQIIAAVNGWVEAMASRDITATMAYYYSKLDIYRKQRNVSSKDVRADIEKNFGLYSNMNIKVSNINVVLDPDGDRGTAVFDKTWDYTGSSNFSGSAQQELRFFRTAGKWHITSERDIKVFNAIYNSNKT
jgi:serine/threonine protein kinase